MQTRSKKGLLEGARREGKGRAGPRGVSRGSLHLMDTTHQLVPRGDASITGQVAAGGGGRAGGRGAGTASPARSDCEQTRVGLLG